MQPGFNLITHPWIPIQTNEGFDTVSLETLFAHAEEITDIVEEAKNRHALYLFLTALCHEAAFQALGGHPTENDLISKKDASQLMAFCQSYLKTPEAKKAFENDTQFLSPNWPEFLEVQTAQGFTPEQIKGETHLSPQEEPTPESLFRKFLGLQAFYPWGPEPGSQRMDGLFHTTLLGPNLAASLWLNLHFLTTKDTENEEASQTEDMLTQIGRCAWAFDINTPKGRTNWITTKVGALTPLFTFLKRTPTGWESGGSTKWDLSNGEFTTKSKGEKTPRIYPDQVGTTKINHLSTWHWKYILGKIENLKSKIHRNSPTRMFTIRVVGVPMVDKNRAATLEKTYHFSGSPEETEKLQRGLKLCEEILEKLTKGIQDRTRDKDKKAKHTPLKNLAISRAETAIETSWTKLASPDGTTFETWKSELSKELIRVLNQLPAASESEFKSIEKTKKALHKVLTT
jgi:hypothetical protein